MNAERGCEWWRIGMEGGLGVGYGMIQYIHFSLWLVVVDIPIV